MINYFLIFSVVFLYITTAAAIWLFSSFCGVKYSKPKNVLLLIIWPVGLWFLK